MNMNLQDIIKPYIKVLNFTLSQKFKWFKKIELEDIKYGGVRGQQNFINPVGKIYVDSDWGHKQWKEYHYESPFPYDEEMSFGDMIGRDLSKKIQEQFKLCFSMVSGEIVPKYMSFSWLDVELVDEQENMLEETIRRILREQTDSRKEENEKKVKFVEKMIYVLYKNVSFIKQSTYNNKPLLIIYFDSDDTAANIESWFDEKISTDIKELTSGFITVCPDWAFNWDSRKKEADVYINTELLRYDNLGNVINESSKSIRRILKEELNSYVRRRVDLSDKKVKNQIKQEILSHSNLLKQHDEVVIEFVLDFTTQELLKWFTQEEYDEYYNSVSDYIKENYSDFILEYFHETFKENDDSTYCFIKHSERFGGRGFTECFGSWHSFLNSYGSWLPDVDWNKVKEKLNTENKILLARPLEGHIYEYFFSVLKK